MNLRSTIVFPHVLLAALLLYSSAFAAEQKADGKECASSEGAPGKAVTQREVAADGGNLKYAATAGTYTIALADVEAPDTVDGGALRCTPHMKRSKLTRRSKPP